MSHSYVPLLFFAGIGAAFAVFSVMIAPIAGPRHYNRAKLDS
jgi:NADH-quinone oxidoreductase subunit A